MEFSIFRQIRDFLETPRLCFEEVAAMEFGQQSYQVWRNVEQLMGTWNTFTSILDISISIVRGVAGFL
jgi:hypothetical protein